MAVRRASASNIEGARYNDASAGVAQIPDVPDKLVLGTAVAGETGVGSGPNTASIPFTTPTGGIPTTIVATSNPGSITGSSTGSPVVVSGLVGGTSYTFTLVGSNTTGSSPVSDPSNQITAISEYQLSSTFNSSGTYTVPSGKTEIAVYMIQGGSSGNAAGNATYGSGGSGGSGGAGGRGIAFKDYAVNSGQTFSVTVGGAGGGHSSFSNLASTQNQTSNVSGAVTANGGSGGNGGGGGSNGSAGGTGGNLVLTDGNKTIATIATGNGGGGGGGGGNLDNANTNTGGAGGSGAGNGGNGGIGAGAGYRSPGGGNNGNNASGMGSGGGGGGGSGAAYNYGAPSPGNGGAGQAGQVLVYAKG